MKKNRRNSPIEELLQTYKRTFTRLGDSFGNLLVISILVYLFLFEYRNSNMDIYNSPKAIILLMGLAVSMIIFLRKFLEVTKTTYKPTFQIQDEIYELKQLIKNSKFDTYENTKLINELQNIKIKLDENQTKGIDLNEEDKHKLFELLEGKLEKNLSKEFLETIQEKYGSEIINAERYSDLLRDLDKLKERLNIEIIRLSRRASTNLAIGSVTTLVAVLVLYLTVEYNHPSFIDSVSLASYFVPRISLVVFIEVFAFFFLKLYRSNLDNIRYYHNEMTNIEMKIVSLKSSIINTDISTINEVIKELSKTERNFIIKKGETTIELEKIRNEYKDHKNILAFAKNLIDSHNK